MGLDEEIEELSSQERRILLAFRGAGSELDVDDIQDLTDLSQSAVMRSALSLEENGFLEISEEVRSEVFLTGEGRRYLEEALPERKVLEVLAQEETLQMSALSEETGLPEGKVGICVGWLKRKGWSEILDEDGEKVLKLTEQGLEALRNKGKDELFLEEFEDVESLYLDQIPAEIKGEKSVLEGRGLIRIKDRISRRLSLTEKGEETLKLDLEVGEKVSRLSKELLVTGKWRKVDLREYNVTAPGPALYPGKEHPQRRIIEELRSILLRMGFEEIKGPIVESEFWNFDALFQAQNHPAREIHDTLSLSKPSKADILDEDIFERVKKAHEEGVAGSDGWGYEFDRDISQSTILRSQTTADTVRYLADRPDPPVKVFCLDKVFRRERIDYQHLAEFPQAEGIAMAPELNFRHMLGYLEKILLEMGVPKIRFRPGYFPYTEPSAEADGYFPELDEWIELLGAGMFRPELLEPLDIDYEVLAWGIGFSRLAMIRMGVEDMRDLHNNDIEWLKERALR